MSSCRLCARAAWGLIRGLNVPTYRRPLAPVRFPEAHPRPRNRTNAGGSAEPEQAPALDKGEAPTWRVTRRPLHQRLQQSILAGPTHSQVDELRAGGDELHVRVAPQMRAPKRRRRRRGATRGADRLGHETPVVFESGQNRHAICGTSRPHRRATEPVLLQGLPREFERSVRVPEIVVCPEPSPGLAPAESRVDTRSSTSW
jgi:hypothetical protein